ncbi:MAG: hypothetical protein ACI8TQ_001602 [Planctomycetota bacterium]|jgi:hypothetical protein
MMRVRSGRKALINKYMEPAEDQKTKAKLLLQDMLKNEPVTDEPGSHLQPLLIAFGCSAIGALPLLAGYDDSILWLAWIAVLALPVGIFTRAEGLRPWPFGLVAPGIWMIALAYLEMDSNAGLPDPAWAAMAWCGLFLVGSTIGAFASGNSYRNAGLGLCVMSLLAWLPVSGGSNANLLGEQTVGQRSPALASQLFDASPVTLLVETAGVDWMRHRCVYTAAGTEWFSDRRRPFDGKVSAPIVLLIGCLGIFLARSRSSSS